MILFELLEIRSLYLAIVPDRILLYFISLFITNTSLLILVVLVGSAVRACIAKVVLLLLVLCYTVTSVTITVTITITVTTWIHLLLDLQNRCFKFSIYNIGMISKWLTTRQQSSWILNKKTVYYYYSYFYVFEFGVEFKCLLHFSPFLTSKDRSKRASVMSHAPLLSWVTKGRWSDSTGGKRRGIQCSRREWGT